MGGNIDRVEEELHKAREQQRLLEEAVIGCILRSPDVGPKAVLGLTPQMFSTSVCNEIFRSVTNLVRRGGLIDVVSVGEELNSRNKLLEVGGATKIVQIYQSTLTGANIDRYIGNMRHAFRLRKIQYIAKEMLRDAEEHRNPDEILSEVGTALTNLVHLSQRHEGKKMSAMINLALDKIAQRVKKESSLAVPTGLAEYDRIHGGMFPENMITIAARPGVGKTAIALALAGFASKTNRVVFASLEMSLQQLSERYISAESGVAAQSIRRGDLTRDDFLKIVEASDRLSELPIESLDLPGATLDQLLLSVRASAMKEPIQLLIIDYIQKIKKSDPRKQQNEHIAECSAALATLSRDLQCPVVVLAQLNRETDKRKNPLPLLADLKGSGSIEEDSDVVILLHWPHALQEKSHKNLLKLIVAKNRHGSTGHIDVGFDRSRMGFFEWKKDDFSDQGGGV
jgi:replicative DNA helicase